MLNRQETDKMYVVWTDPYTKSFNKIDYTFMRNYSCSQIYEWKDVHYDDRCYSNVI